MNQLSRYTHLTKERLKLALAIAITLFFSCLFSANAQTLVWEENFDIPTVNGNTWTYDFGDGSERAAGYGWGNSELEYYTSRLENVRVEDGSLVIEARKENFGPSSLFTSGRVKTEGRVHFKYGTIEARIKIPNVTKGLWPAFWTLGTIGESWPSIGEIDMMEVGSAEALAGGLGNKRVSAAAHWSNAGGSHEFNVFYKDAPVDLSLDYHLYKMVWTSQYIKMYLDNVEYYSFDITGANLNEFHNPHFLLLNLAVGGQYTGIFDAAGITAPLPGKMYVDYVKLYQNPGDELILGSESAEVGNFGVLTEETPISDSLIYGTDASLYYWNNLTNIIVPKPIPFEGDSLLAVRAVSGDWFGLGIVNRYINLSNFTTGSLKFHFKTTYTGQFKVGVTSGHGQSWINFAAGTSPYGLVRDGNWHEISIPMADFNNSSEGRNIDLYSIKAAFMFAGDPAVSNADFYFDNMYFSGGISPNPPPTVSIVSPANNAIIITPANVTINAEAADENGSVTKVDFYSGNTFIGTDDTSPYSFTWNSPAAKVDTITAKATDDEGSVTTSAPIIIFVSAPGNTAPAAAITSPANNASFFTPASITINATATDGDGSIYKVEFYSGENLLATSTTSPYSFIWTGATAGNYVLKVKAIDNGGLTITSSVVNIMVVDPIKPTVKITSPVNNSSFTPPATIVINADAADGNGTVTKVEFYNGSNLLGSDNNSPYTFTWNDVILGNYSLTAKATDNDGNFTVSEPVTIKVAPAACTGVAVSGDYSYEVYTNAGIVYYKFHPLAPILGSSSAIIYIKEGTGSGTYPGYGMTASGSDFVFNRTIANGTITSFYFSYNVPSGGERNSSANPHAYIVGTVCVAGAPAVSITSPTEASSYIAPANITIEASASDDDGTVSKVEFYSGATLLGMDETSPYSLVWNTVPAGSYALTAKATDNSGLSNTSSPVNIIVNAPNTNGYCGTAFSGDYEYKAETRGGIVTFTFHPLTPIAGCLYAIINLTAIGQTNAPMIASGTDFIYSIPIPDATVTSFYFTYNTPPAGERNSSDHKHGYTVGTNCIGIPGTTPTVAITSPINNASFTEPALIPITVTAADLDGTVNKVDFYSGPVFLGTDNTSPYSIEWPGVPAGNYTITAKATDNSTLSTISTPVNLVVNIDNSEGFCGTVDNGDYSYKVETVGGNVIFQFHPLAPIAGCSYALIYVREGLTGGYPGYNMTAIGPDFRFIKAIGDATPISIYFTYNVPSGGERNSSATPHSYTVGTICDGILPVKLLNYSAALQADGKVAVTWSTTTEINNDYFIIEKSKDGRSFTNFSKIPANYSPLNKNDYKVLDMYPENGLNYYRLKQVDKDGRTTVYGVKTVNVIRNYTGIIVYPNPLKGTLINIKLASPTLNKLNVRLVSTDGKIVFSGSLMPTGYILQVKLSIKPPSGVYLLWVDGNAPVKLVID